MRLIVTGGSGTLGRHVVAVAREREHVVVAPSHHDFDIAKSEYYSSGNGLQEVIHGVDVLINCAGIIPARMAVSSHGKASPVQMASTNTVGPHMLAAMCAYTNTHMIHMSTDCVFSGKEGWQRSGCMPEARPDPDTLYGRTKLAGEPYANVLVVRGSFIDPDAGFLHWLLRARGLVDAWRNAYWSGTSARRMAELLVNEAESPTADGKVVHAASEDIVTKAQLVSAFAERLDLPVNINITDRPIIYRGLVPTPGFELPPVMQVVNELADEVQRVST